ncbi:hypothetical protein FJ546_24350 [Mesorhizobium sp. B2-4-19]|uniref:hypothetical protein n=1 Tax=Mesorhizobium sp. B2-4-19 TaxID=2589930 RepID=UPI00112B86D6|nr:hypothetical protein [Mesorhizobium sp. B2-4-19]TPK58223.1 hypothetical protein FJ546_24350 [Mesorhizobium sp. B2-4-19]
MNWPNRGDIAGIFIIAALLGSIFYVWVFHPGLSQKPNYGFGPEWECLPMQKGDPICFKRPATKTESQISN